MEARLVLAPTSFPTRRLVVVGLTAAPSIALAAPCRRTRVLFVCPAGTVKSAIAREMLRRRVAAAGLPVDVSSRGLQVEDHMSPALAASLHADGIDPARDPARPLAEDDLAHVDIVIAFDEAADAPALHGARVWRTPSWNADYPAAKADLSRRTEALMADLRQRAGTCR